MKLEDNYQSDIVLAEEIIKSERKEYQSHFKEVFKTTKLNLVV